MDAHLCPRYHRLVFMVSTSTAKAVILIITLEMEDFHHLHPVPATNNSKMSFSLFCDNDHLD